ncbi:ABC transporter permease [Streptomyces sp. MZ04]|uniref:ABC transporter permease n=1 Tax=Streptomyces sp. MZ04 TaxID=2559236 RepID=UPI00107E91E0|nr:ABC transporter permease [Streptomyces sp. MZ04]TGB12684.1 ABC transporter permease [Streptomyces sp. MZ04]
MSSPLLHGPRWADVRLHRTALWTAGGLVVLAAVVTGYLRWAASAYPASTADCYGPCEDTFLGFASAMDLLSSAMEQGAVALLLLPVLIGAFVAGPVIGREMESGAYKLAWTQSVSPARWLASKLTTAAALTAGGALVLMAVFQLGAWNLLGRWNLSWTDRGVYEAVGPALVAYCLFGVAVGALVGLLVRRTLLALSVAGVVTGGVLLALGNIRWNLFPVNTVSGPASGAGYLPKGIPADSLIMDIGVHNAAGEHFIAGQCTPGQGADFPCPADTRITGWYAEFHPHSHFWYVQLIETGIVLVLAAAAGYAAFRVLKRRTP